MQAAATSPPHLFRQPSIPPIAFALSIIVGVIAPLVSAIVYRTYALSLSPSWLEITRQLGVPYVLGEIGVIIYARRHGFVLNDVLRRLDVTARSALGLFLATFWISSVCVAAMPSFSAALCLIWVLHLYTAAAVFHLAGAGGFNPRRFALGYALGLAALTPIIALHFALAPPDAGPSTWMFGAPIPGFISIRLFGAWAGAGLALLLGLAWIADHDGEAPRWLYPAIALAAGLVVWTGTRAAVYGVVVAVIAAAAFTRGTTARGFWRKSTLAMAIGIVAMLLLMPTHADAGFLFRPSMMGSADSFASGRLELWTKSLAVAVQRPWLGHGMGSSWWLVSLEGHFHVQPHNALVQFFLNWGLVPTGPALFLLGKAIWHVHRIARRGTELLALVMMLDFLLAVSLLDGMFHFPQFVMLIAILISVCLAHDKPSVPSG